MVRFVSSFCFFLFTSMLLHAQKSNSLQRYFDQWKTDNDLKNALIGFYVKDIKNNTVLVDNFGQIAMQPASTQKLITTAAALQLLGADYRFVTRLSYSGNIDSTGILHGNLYIEGGGDPCLGSERFTDFYRNDSLFAGWVRTIKKLGIKHITGYIVGNDTIYDRNIPSTWIWEDMGNYYGAGAYGLSVLDNTYYLYFNSPSVANKLTAITGVSPNFLPLTFGNEVTSAAITSDQSYIFGSPLDKNRIVQGNIPLGRTQFEVKGSLPNPPLMAATLLQKHLESNNIFSDKGAGDALLFYTDTLVAKKRSTIVDSIVSPPLYQIVEATNMRSINLYAEHLLKHLGYTQKGYGSIDNGITVVNEFWQQKGIDMSGVKLLDGSGLSPFNSLPASVMVDILSYMHNQTKGDNVFYHTLPVAGQMGTIAGMCKGTAAEGNLRAKSGSLRNVRAFAGYVTTLSGRFVAFSIMVRGYNCSSVAMRAKIEQLMIAIANTND